MTQRSGFGSWLITSPKSDIEPHFKHYRNPVTKPVTKPRRMIYFCLANAKVKVDHEVKVRSQPLRSRFEIGVQVAYQSPWESRCDHNGNFFDSLSQFDLIYSDEVRHEIEI